MSAINNDKAMKSILEGVDYMIKKAIKDAPSDKIYVATVLEAKNNNLYKIQLKDKVYDNIPSLFQDIIQNEPVRVVVPQNNYNQMFILGKHNMDSIGDYNNLKNKPQINGVELKGNKTAKDLGLVSEAMIAELYTDKEFKAGEYTIYKGEIYKAKKNTKITVDEETKYVPPYDTDYWEKIPNVMSQIVALARMYNDFDNYTKGDYAMYDGEMYKLIKDNNDSTGIFYPYLVNESESQSHTQITTRSSLGWGENSVAIKGSGALVWFMAGTRTSTSKSCVWMMVSQDPDFTLCNIKADEYNQQWFQDLLNNPTSDPFEYEYRIRTIWNTPNTYGRQFCRRYELDNGEVWYLRRYSGTLGADVEPHYAEGTREDGIHIPVDTSVWYYDGLDAGENNILTKAFLEYILSIIITKGAKQPPTNPNYWRKVNYIVDEITDYDNLKNKPKINGHELIGDKSTADLEILPPIASKTQFGGVIIGDGINVDGTGKISIDGNFLPTPTLDGNIMVVENEEWVQKPLEDTETDPTVPQYVKDITEEDIERWNQGGGGSGLPTPTAKDNILVSTEDNWEQKNISTSTIPSFTKAEYELLKDTIPTGTRFIITDDNDPSSSNVYSTEEQIIGRWIDDKILYQKTFELTTDSTQGIASISLGLSNVGIYLIDATHSFVTDSTNLLHLMPSDTSTDTRPFACNLSLSTNGILSLFYNNQNSSYFNKPMYVTIQYTKITN